MLAWLYVIKVVKDVIQVKDVIVIVTVINDSETNKPDTPLSFHNLIQANTQTLHTLKHTNSNLLLFLEALYIKYRKPVLNIGLKASKELVVFS